MVGYRSIKEDIEFGVELMPYRKKPCLAIRRRNVVVKYASFNNEYAAREFIDFLAEFFNLEKIDWSDVDSIPVRLCTSEKIWEKE